MYKEISYIPNTGFKQFYVNNVLIDVVTLAWQEMKKKYLNVY